MVAAPIYLSPTVHKGSLFSTSLTTLVISCLFDNSHSNRCEVITYCGFDLHFRDDKWCCASFHVSVGHLYVFFGKMFIQVFCPFFFFLIFIYLFIYLWLCWVFVSVRGLSPVAASWGHSSSQCAGLSLSRPLLLRSTGSRHAGSVVVAHGPSCSAACGIFPDQGSNLCPLHWQADSQPLRHQGSPAHFLIRLFFGKGRNP